MIYIKNRNNKLVKDISMERDAKRIMIIAIAIIPIIIIIMSILTSTMMDVADTIMETTIAIRSEKV
jgi:hypothetical protein